LNILHLDHPKLRDFGQFVVLQFNYDVIKLQECQLWRHVGDVIKLRHQNDVTIFLLLSPPLPCKILVAPLHVFTEI